MGFVASKNYADLKTKFDEQVKSLKEYHGVSEIANLKQPRQSQVNFLYKTIELLDKSKYNATERAHIFTGAALIILSQIDNSYIIRSSANSYFSRLLTSGLGMTKDNEMDSNSTYRLTSKAMTFLTEHLFVDYTTTDTLIEDDEFSTIKGFDVGAFWNRGIELGADARKKVFDEAAASMQVVDQNYDNVGNETKANGSFDKLKLKFNAKIILFIGHHGKEHVNQLPQPRRNQVEFLQKTIELLDKSKYSDEERANIFIGNVLVVLSQIEQSYTFRSPENSNLSELLKSMLDGDMDANRSSRLTSKARNFMTKHIFVDANKTDKLIENNPFAKIEAFDLKAFWTRMIDLGATDHKAVYSDAYTRRENIFHEREEAARKAKGGRSLFGFAFLGGKKEPLPVDHEDFEAQSNVLSN